MAAAGAVVASAEAKDGTAPGKDHRTVINGILWVLRTGAPWRDLPERYGPWRTAATRFYRWRQLGLWDRLLAEVQQQADAGGQIDWEVHYVDGTVVRAHQHAAGAKRGEETRRWGAHGEDLERKSTYGWKARASRWPSF